MTVPEILLCIAILPLLTGFVVLLISGKKNPRKNEPVALLFHSVSLGQNTHLSHFPPDKFREFISTLAQQNFGTCTLREVPASGVCNQPPKLILTFDDGFENFYTHAFPVLEDHSTKATIFPIAGVLGQLSGWDVLPKQRHLTKTQLRDIADHGHEIGSHTMTHPDLAFCNDEDLDRELRGSKQVLEDITGRPVTSLSFPFGSWNTRIWQKAVEIGYTRGTCYRRHGKITQGLIPVCGIYSFDTVRDVLDKANPPDVFLNSLARSCVIPHFSKGTPLWKFRKNYSFLHQTT